MIFALSGFCAFEATGAGHARSIELRFRNGVVDRLELDSTMTMEFRDGEILFRTSRGHVSVEPEILDGWTFSPEPSVPLLNDMVTSAGAGAEVPSGACVSVEGRRVIVRGSGRGPVVLSDAWGRIVNAASSVGDVWFFPELASGVYILRNGDISYKIYVR